MINPSEETGFIVGDGTQVKQLRYNLFQSCSWVNNLSRKFLDPFGITPKQYSILLILASKHPESLSIQEVRESLADKMSDASRLIDRLEKKEFLTKFPSEFDRRSNRTRVTDQGIKLIKTIAANRANVDRAISDRLTVAEMEQLNRLLSRLK